MSIIVADFFGKGPVTEDDIRQIEKLPADALRNDSTYGTKVQVAISSLLRRQRTNKWSDTDQKRLNWLRQVMDRIIQITAT